MLVCTPNCVFDVLFVCTSRITPICFFANSCNWIVTFLLPTFTYIVRFSQLISGFTSLRNSIPRMHGTSHDKTWNSTCSYSGPNWTSYYTTPHVSTMLPLANRTYFTLRTSTKCKPKCLTTFKLTKLLLAPLSIMNNKLLSFKTPFSPSNVFAVCLNSPSFSMLYAGSNPNFSFFDRLP